MKKIKLSVAALLIAMSSYSQTKCNYACGYEQDEKGNTIHQSKCDLSEYQQNIKKFTEVEYRLMDLVDAIKMDIFYGYLEKERGMYYVNELVAIKERNR